VKKKRLSSKKFSDESSKLLKFKLKVVPNLFDEVLFKKFAILLVSSKLRLPNFDESQTLFELFRLYKSDVSNFFD
jgi:hypothetical protein